ncbi:hypothetical protein ACIQU5_30530 [Streptomyces sp. NPDC090306]
MERDIDALELLSGKEESDHILDTCSGATCNGGNTCGISCNVTN